MRISKYVHSCLLAENGEHTVLFDPGVFSWESGEFDIGAIKKLDYIVITHEHPDHFHKPFVQKVIEKFPDLKFVSTQPVADELKNLGIKRVTTESDGPIEIFSKKKHAPLGPIAEAPENIAVHFDNLLTVGGDRHDLEETKKYLALTITGPWGSMVSALEMAINLGPEKAIPIHDWHWGDKGRQWSYDLSKSVLEKHNIELITPRDGEPISL